MLLRIIDNSNSENTRNSIKIILENEGKVEKFIVESYASPITDNFRKILAWYFSDYCQGIAAGNVHDAGVSEKLIKYGQYIGDELLGEDHQLMKIKNIIERNGYENLHVQIESTRPEFFKEQWETIILPESKYVLSAVVKGYVRQFIHSDFPNDYSELRYDLKVTPASQNKIAKILQSDGANPVSQIQKTNKPLNILYIVSRPETLELVCNSSNSVNISLDAVAAGGVINYEIHQTMHWEQLHNRLSDKTRPVHILHYDGPIILQEEIAYFALANSTAADMLVATNDLAKILVNNRVGALCVDARVYLQNGQNISATEGLATIARSAQQHGLGNVIGLGQITNPWVSGECFKAVYAKIAEGLSLDQAIVEARKALQSNIETSLMTVTPKPFHPWSLLVHYGRQAVTFFESPQGPAHANDSRGLELFHDKLFGFRAEMLPPLLNQVGDSQVLSLIDKLLNAQQLGSSQAVSIIGESGSGKSQLAHVVSLYFAQKQYIDYGFYFNFTSDAYSPNDMLEMIAPVLLFNPNQKAEVEEKLMQLHCLFVLDNVLSSEDQPTEFLQTLRQFLQKLISFGHIIIFAGESHSVLHELALIKIETTPLSLIEQKIIAVESLRQLHLTDEELTEVDQDEEWVNLLTSVNGHPWLTKKLMPLLHSFSANELTIQVKQHINSTQNYAKIEQFYEWQWAALKPVWQRLLILCGDVRGLLLEILMTASDQKESFLPAKNLFTLLGETDENFAEGLAIWESSGFLSRLPHGRTVDSRCLYFLKRKRETCFDGIDQQKLQFHFSQLICEGIRLLAQHVVKQPNPAISNNLLINRRNWVKHFENLWFNQDYKGFIGVKNAFDQLLRQAKLDDESKVWILDMLERSPVPTTSEATSIEAKLCWLLLASGVLGQAEAKNNKCILDGAEVWRTWFNSFVESVDKQQLSLFQQVVTFLENFYLSKSDWHNCIAVCEKTYAIYTQYDAWQKVIQSLKSLARYHYELGEKDQALIFENKIMNDIPYADSPPGFQTQQILDILFARLSRADTQQAQTLLDHLRNTDEAEKLVDLLDGVQCDVDYQEEKYLAALPYYCKIWTRALQSNQQAQIEQLKLRLMELEQKIGLVCFDECFEREVPKGTIKPKDYVSVLH